MMFRPIDISNIGNINSKFKEPYFRLEDLDLNEFKKNQNFIPGSYIEPERLTSIYQQAFIYDLLYKFAKEYLPDVQDFTKKNINNDPNPCEKDQTTDTTIDKIKEKVIEYLFNQNIKIEEKKATDTNNSVNDESSTAGIWNSDDLNLLRKNSENIKENNIKLRSQVAAFEEENKKLKEKLTFLELTSKNSNDERTALEQENERLYIRIQNLESRYHIFLNELKTADKEKKSFNEDLTELKKSNQQLKIDNSKLEFELNKTEQKMVGIRNEQAIQCESMIEALKVKFKKKISSMEEQYADLLERYNDKRLNTDKTKKALDHLRHHFMVSCSNYETDDRLDDNLIK